MNYYYLRIGCDPLDDAAPYRTLKEAAQVFKDAAEDLARFEQRLDATIHIGESSSTIAEYPDYCLALGPRGGLKIERA